MMRSIVLLCCFALLPATAMSGGWSVVTVDEWPESPQVGTPVLVSFAVRAHGRQLADGLNMQVVARHVDTGQKVKVRAHARERGHYEASLPLDRVGTWTWVIKGYGEHPMPELDVGAKAPKAVDGRRLFVAKGCVTCHTHRGIPNEGLRLRVGPDLTDYQAAPAYVEQWLTNPKAIKPATEMPDLALSSEEVAALVRYLAGQPHSP